jgi:cysteine desulfurase
MLWKKRIYADAAGATPMSKSSKRELVRLLDVYGNPSGLHSEAVEAKKELDAARTRVAASIGAHADEIVFTSGGTEGNNLALNGILQPLLGANSKVRAITSSIEHSSVLEPLRALQEEGLELIELPVNSAGLISLQALEEALTPETAFVSIQLINSEIGTVQPIREIAKAIRHARREVKLPVFHTDASQAPLWKDLMVEKLGVDLMTLDGQKILGPKGIGALFVRRGLKLRAQQKGGDQERGFRSGTESVALAGAFSVALKEAQANHSTTAKNIALVRDILLQEILKQLPDVRINGAVGDERVANNLAISIPHLDGQMAVIALSALGVAAATRSACDTNVEEPSHVLQALGLSLAEMQTAIRLTLLPDATKRDANQIATALAEVAKRYRNVAY